MTQLMPVQQKAATVRNMLEKSKSQIAQALPRGYLTVDRLTRIAMTSVQRTPRLLDCDPISLVGAVIQSAQLGLEPDGVLGQAYLIPYGGKVQFQPGYKGLLVLARRSGDISGVEARVVHERDTFKYSFGLQPKLEHVPSTEEDRGKPTYIYAIVRLKDGTAQWDVMSAGEIEAHRKRYSRASDDGPWVTAWEEMAKKTVLKRVLKLAPASVELQRAIALDEHAEAGLSQDLDAVATAAADGHGGKPTSKLDNLADQLEQDKGKPAGEASTSASGSEGAKEGTTAAAKEGTATSGGPGGLFGGEPSAAELWKEIQLEPKKWGRKVSAAIVRELTAKLVGVAPAEFVPLRTEVSALSDVLKVFRDVTAKKPEALERMNKLLPAGKM